jgi:hypothetical protein
MTNAVPRHERDPTAAERPDGDVAARWSEGRVEVHRARVVKQGVEAGPTDDADIG